MTNNKNAANGELVDDLDEAGFIAAEAKFNERSSSPLTPFGSYLLGESIRAYLNSQRKECATSAPMPEAEKDWHKQQWELIDTLYKHSQTRPVSGEALTHKPEPVAFGDMWKAVRILKK